MVDPRIVALAKDPRLEAMWPAIVTVGRGGQFVGRMRDTIRFTAALEEHGLRFGLEPMRELYAYARGVADGVAAQGWEQALAVLRQDAAAMAMRQHEVIDGMMGTLISAGLVDNSVDPLEITPLGRAVLIVLERAPG